MCKSANERGGPYRCPGDMQKNLATAMDQYSDAVAAKSDTYQAWQQSIKDLEDEAEANSARQRSPDTELLSSEQHGLAAARAAVETARDRHGGSNVAIRAARARMWQARADYDATPRGMAELEAQADHYRRTGDTKTAESLEQRVGLATHRVNDEEITRHRVAERQGVARETFSYAAMTPSKSWETTSSDTLVREDNIAGVSKAHTDPNDNLNTVHRVTLTRIDDDGAMRSMSTNVSLHSNDSGGPPSTALVLDGIAKDSTTLDESNNDFETWRTNMQYPSVDEDPAEHRQARAHFDSIAADQDRAVKLVGKNRWSEYKAPHFGQ